MAEPIDDHVSVDEIADADEGLVAPGRAAQIDAHLAWCADCAEQRHALAGVATLLSRTPGPSMPTAVVDRLDAVLVTEHARRTVRGRPPWGDVGQHGTRPSLGTFSQPPTVSRGRWWRTALVAVAAAGAVGFAGFAISSGAGLNEPTASSTVAVESSELGSEAAALAKREDLDIHLFSVAWRCANRVLKGRITGIAPVTMDGDPALLVYVRASGRTTVTIVRGCPGNDASAGPSAVLPN